MWCDKATQKNMIMLWANPIPTEPNELANIFIAETYEQTRILCTILVVLSNYVLTNDCQLYKFQPTILSVWKAEVKLVRSTIVYVNCIYSIAPFQTIDFSIVVFHSNIYSLTVSNWTTKINEMNYVGLLAKGRGQWNTFYLCFNFRVWAIERCGILYFTSASKFKLFVINCDRHITAHREKSTESFCVVVLEMTRQFPFQRDFILW